MQQESTRPTLLARLVDPRDEAAWEEFDARYRALILSYCRRRGLQHWDAEDVRQIVLLSLSRAFKTFRYDPQVGRFRHYLGRAVRNAVGRHYARSSARLRVMSDEVFDLLVEEPDRTPDPEWEREWRAHHLREAMGQLRRTTKDRDIEIFDALLSGEGVEQIGPRFGLSDQAVHKVKQRVRRRLRTLVSAQVRAEDAIAV